MEVSGTRVGVAIGVVLAGLTLLVGLGVLIRGPVRPVVTAGQAADVARRSIPSVGPPFSTFTGYRLADARFELHAAHVYEVAARNGDAGCGPGRPAFACPPAPGWMITFVAPPQDGYQTIQVTMLVDPVRGAVYDWDVRAAGP